MFVCKDSAAPAHARTRAHRPAAPRQGSWLGLTLTPTRAQARGAMPELQLQRVADAAHHPAVCQQAGPPHRPLFILGTRVVRVACGVWLYLYRCCPCGGAKTWVSCARVWLCVCEEFD